MKTVTLTSASDDLKRLLAIAEAEEVLLRMPGGDEFMLSMVDEVAHQIDRPRRNRKLKAFLDRRFKQVRVAKGIPLAEVERRLGLPPYRPKRRKASRERSKRS